MIRSPRLTRAGFDHGFSLRDFGDDLTEHRRRFSEALGTVPFELSQVHGRRVWRVSRRRDPEGFARWGEVLEKTSQKEVLRSKTSGEAPRASPRTRSVRTRRGDPEGFARRGEVLEKTSQKEVSASELPKTVRQREGDALWTDAPGVAVAVRVADCIPLLLAHPDTGAVAAVHAGWRGVEARIAQATIEAMEVEPAELVCAIGPHIRLEKFEVGADVAQRLAAVAHGRDVIDRSYDKPHVDLTGVLRAQLESLGVVNIDDVGGCTFSDAERFFSYRRDGSKGRHMAGIVSPPR